MRRFIGWPVIAVIGLFGAAIIVMAAVPPFSRDAVIHHLAIPKLYLEQGGIVELPQYLFSYYPQLLDMLYMLPLAAGADYAAKYIHFSFAVFTALLIYLFIRRYLERVWALVGVLLFVTVPVIVRLSVIVYVDLGLVFFSTAALLSVILWLEKGHMRWLLAAGISCGLALSVKYNGLLTLFILSGVIPLFYLRSLEAQDKAKNQFAAIRYAAIFVFLVLLVFSPWMVKNYSWTGNPLHPLLGSVFTPQQVVENPLLGEVPDSLQGVGHFWFRKHQYDETAAETLLTPLRMFFQGEDGNPKLFDGELNPVLLLFPLLLLIGVRHPALSLATKVLTTFSLLYILLVFLTVDMRTRYVAPALPALAILASFGLNSLWQRLAGSGWQRSAPSVAAVLLLLAMVPNMNYLAGLWKEIDPVPYLSGRQSRVEYLAERIPSYAITNYANALLPQESRILAVYLGQRSYYFDRSVGFRYHDFLAVLQTSKDAGEVLEFLAGRDFSHLMLRLDLFNGWLAEQPAERKRLVIGFFEKHTELLHSVNGYGLFKIKS
jgi:hypothetical protein